MKAKRISLCIAMVILISLGASLTIKASIGVGAWDALSITGSRIFEIEIGTAQIFLNFLCIGIQLAILKKEFNFRHILQIFLSLLIGITVNFILYNLLEKVELVNYTSRLAIFILGNIINGFSIAIIMLLDVVSFPLEGACMAFSKKFGFEFHKIRQYMDGFFIVLVLIYSFISRETLIIREGTVISMIIYGPLIGFFMRKLKPTFQRKKLTDI